MQPDETLITVILTTCDRPFLLERALASVLRQDHHRWALIVVDDGAIDCPRQLADPRVEYVRTRGRVGAAAARNMGMERANSDWMVLLDDDDEMEDGYLSHFIEHFGHRGGQPAFALSDWRILDYGGNGDVERERRRTYDLTQAPSQQNIHQALRSGACGLAINQQALACAGPMDTRYALTEDTEWILRLIEAGCAILYASGPGFVIHNRRSPDQLSTEKHFSARILECRELKARYGDLGGRFPELGAMFDGLINNYAQRARQS